MITDKEQDRDPLVHPSTVSKHPCASDTVLSTEHRLVSKTDPVPALGELTR